MTLSNEVSRKGIKMEQGLVGDGRKRRLLNVEDKIFLEKSYDEDTRGDVIHALDKHRTTRGDGALIEEERHDVYYRWTSILYKFFQYDYVKEMPYWPSWDDSKHPPPDFSILDNGS